jgi:GTP cyclohydrolase I
MPVTWDQHVRDLLILIGEDPDREGLRETPRRVRESWASSCAGYQVDIKKLVKTFATESSSGDLVSMTNIPVYSHCEHHLLPFFGVAHVAYAPTGRILGLSKIARIVEAFAARLQVQERLTADVAEAIFEHLGPRGVAVIVECRHLCVELRGVRARGISTRTSALRGSLERCPQQYADFLREVRRDERAGSSL